MKRFFEFATMALAVLILSACLGSGGSWAPAPLNVTVTPKDSRVVVTWDALPGAVYWVWDYIYNGVGVTTQNCSSQISCSTDWNNPTSPASIIGSQNGGNLYTRLVNGTTYSFTVNGRYNGGAGGPGSPALQATPRLAADTWTPNETSGLPMLNGVVYGGPSVPVGGGMFVAVGALNTNGIAYASPDGLNWTSVTTSTYALNAVTFDNVNADYWGVGMNGDIIAMVPDITATPWNSTDPWIWSEIENPPGSVTPYNLRAIATNGAGVKIAVGDNGTLIYNNSASVNIWTNESSLSPFTSSDLYGIAYGSNSAYSGSTATWVVVGQSGVLYYNQNYGTTGYWLQGTCSNCTGNDDLKSVVYVPADPFNSTNNTYNYAFFIAVGSGGTVLTSPDGINWTRQTTNIPSASNLTSIAYSAQRRIVVTGDEGNIYYINYYTSTPNPNSNPYFGQNNTYSIFSSSNGAPVWNSNNASWTIPYTASAALNAVATGGWYDFSAVGGTSAPAAMGITVYAD